MTKYKQYYQDMMDKHAEVFSAFKVVHDRFALDPETWAEKFHTQGREVLDIIRDYERRLCAGMERGKNATYSFALAEKFKAEIKKYLPKFELIGVRSKKHDVSDPTS